MMDITQEPNRLKNRDVDKWRIQHYANSIANINAITNLNTNAYDYSPSDHIDSRRSDIRSGMQGGQGRHDDIRSEVRESTSGSPRASPNIRRSRPAYELTYDYTRADLDDYGNIDDPDDPDAEAIMEVSV